MTAAPFLNRLAPLVAVGILLWTVWYHLSHPLDLQVSPGASTPVPAGTATLATPAANFQEIAGWSLFGTPAPADAVESNGPGGGPEGAPAPDDASLQDLPPSSLGLQLSGIAYSLDVSRAYAIIGTPDGQQRQYKVGETIQDGVTVHAVQPLDVVISNRGQLESVALPLESAGQPPAAAPTRRLPFAVPNLPEFRANMVPPDGPMDAPPIDGPNP